MSAYMVSDKHLSAMVYAAMAYRRNNGFSFYWTRYDCEDGELMRCGVRREYLAGDENKLMAMLHAACRRSILSRYPGDSDYAGPETAPLYCPPLGTDREKFKAVDYLKIINCYEYQSCEADDWSESEASAFCRALESDLVRKLPGYEEAPWGL